MIVHLRKNSHRNDGASELKTPEFTTSNELRTAFPPPEGRATSLAGLYQQRYDTNMVSRPIEGRTIQGRGLMNLSDKLSKLDIKKLNNENPAVRF
jgi:hypothetical protein